MINSQEKYNNVLQILQKSPVVGLYKNQTPQQFNKFFQIFLKFLQSEEGPRGDATKKSRQYLNKNQQMTQYCVDLLGLAKSYLIRDIYVKFKLFIPTPLYIRFQIDNQKLRQIQANASKIVDKQSLMYKNISEGLLKKHGQQYDIESKMKQITESYFTRLQQKQQQVIKLEQQLFASDDYHKYEKMRKYLEPVMQLFEQVEKEIGNGNVQRGKLFEQKCRKQGISCVFSKLGHSNFEIVTNCKWEPQQLGQVDIALIQQINEVRTVTVLIQCKSRLFDLCAAIKQIGPEERLIKNKKILKVGKNFIPVLDNDQYFIMTGLPSNQYHLAFQSRLKAQLQKNTKTLSFSQINPQQLYQTLRPKFQKQISPLQWFKENAEKRLIII